MQCVLAAAKQPSSTEASACTCAGRCTRASAHACADLLSQRGRPLLLLLLCGGLCGVVLEACSASDSHADSTVGDKLQLRCVAEQKLQLGLQAQDTALQALIAVQHHGKQPCRKGTTHRLTSPITTGMTCMA
jgi:hypothetical protein